MPHAAKIQASPGTVGTTYSVVPQTSSRNPKLGNDISKRGFQMNRKNWSNLFILAIARQRIIPNTVLSAVAAFGKEEDGQDLVESPYF